MVIKCKRKKVRNFSYFCVYHVGGKEFHFHFHYLDLYDDVVAVVVDDGGVDDEGWSDY
jgi:hypothetical protein